MPASNYPGIPVGGAAWLAEPTLIEALTHANPQPLFVLAAKTLAIEHINPTTPCSQLVCPPGSTSPYCLPANAEYWQLPGIAVQAGATNIVSIEGCSGSELYPEAGPRQCGSTWGEIYGNLNARVVPVLEEAPLDSGLFMVQATQLSPGLMALQGDSGTTAVSFGVVDDSGASIAELARVGDLVPALPVALTLPAGLPTFGRYGFAIDVGADQAGGAGHLWMSLAQAQDLVAPEQPPNVYYGGTGRYVVAVLGDPQAPHAYDTSADASYDGRGLHLLVLPTTGPATP
jgi:hypothetical protein